MSILVVVVVSYIKRRLEKESDRSSVPGPPAAPVSETFGFIIVQREDLGIRLYIQFIFITHRLTSDVFLKQQQESQFFSKTTVRLDLIIHIYYPP